MTQEEDYLEVQTKDLTRLIRRQNSKKDKFTPSYTIKKNGKKTEMKDLDWTKYSNYDLDDIC